MEFPFEHIEKFIFETIFVIFHNIRWLFCFKFKKKPKWKNDDDDDVWFVVVSYLWILCLT